MSTGPDKLYLRIHELVVRQCDDSDSHAAAELAELLGENAEARDLYIEYMHEAVNLGWWSLFGIRTRQSREAWKASTAGSSPPPAATIVPRTFALTRSVVLYATVACLLVATGVAYMGWNRGSNPDSATITDQNGFRGGAAARSSGVATIVRTSDTVWRPNYPVPADFSRLAVGNFLALDRGQIELIFDTGVEVVARGPCRIRITSPNSIFAERGAISARVGNTGKGFKIDTPSTQLLDLGTAFGVDVDPRGITDVAVFDGMVDLTSGRTRVGHPDRLFQGDAVQVSNDGQTRRLVAFDSFKFPVAGDMNREATSRRPIITNVRDNINEGDIRKSYRINRIGLWEDSPAFVDRDHEWNGVDERGLPEELRGAEYVMPFNDDKFVKDLEVRIDISRPAVIYVLMSDTVALPDWLTSQFEDTGLAVGLDEGPFSWEPNQTVDVGPGKSIDTVFSVWRLVVPKPGTITLGGVAPLPDTNEGYNMYGIVATELKDDGATSPE